MCQFTSICHNNKFPPLEIRIKLSSYFLCLSIDCSRQQNLIIIVSITFDLSMTATENDDDPYYFVVILSSSFLSRYSFLSSSCRSTHLTEHVDTWWTSSRVYTYIRILSFSIEHKIFILYLRMKKRKKSNFSSPFIVNLIVYEGEKEEYWILYV
jgi:hypothetical protein